MFPEGEFYKPLVPWFLYLVPHFLQLPPRGYPMSACLWWQGARGIALLGPTDYGIREKVLSRLPSQATVQTAD